MSTLVILGAADGSLPTYRTARELGYRTISVDRSPHAPGVELADEYLPVSTRDAGRIAAELAGRADLAGVVAPASDIALPAQRELAIRLGLPGLVSEPAVRASVDKPYFRQVCDELGLPSYRWVAGHDAARLAGQARELRFPVVVKPADAQSGRGLNRCAGPADVPPAIEVALPASYGAGVVVEEEVLGLHCSCECFVDDGRVAFMAVSARSIAPAPLAISTAHAMPVELPGDTEAALTTALDKLCARLDYRRGPLNLDVVIGLDGQPYLLEMGARLGGNGLGDLARYCYGVDVVRASVYAAVGAPFEVTAHPPKPVLWQVLATSEAGTLTAVTGAAEAAAMPEVAELVLLARPGDAVRPYVNVANKLGYALLVGESVPALRAAADRLLRTVRFELS